MGTEQGGIRAPSPDPLLRGRGRIAEPRPAPEGVLVGAGVARETVRAAAEQEPRVRGGYRTLRRLARARTGWVGAALLVLVIAVALAAPLVAPYGFNELSLANRLKPPAWLGGGTSAHLLGTDPLGRDMLSRVIWAARTSLGIAGISVLVAMVFGVMIGLLSGFYGGWLDMLVMRLADMQLSFPYLLLAIAVMALLHPTLANLIIVLALQKLGSVRAYGAQLGTGGQAARVRRGGGCAGGIRPEDHHAPSHAERDRADHRDQQFSTGGADHTGGSVRSIVPRQLRREL